MADVCVLCPQSFIVSSRRSVPQRRLVSRNHLMEGREGGRRGGRETGREGGREAGREGGREGGMDGGREGGLGREAGREGGSEAGRAGGRQAGRQGGREGWRQGGTETGRVVERQEPGKEVRTGREIMRQFKSRKLQYIGHPLRYSTSQP